MPSKKNIQELRKFLNKIVATVFEVIGLILSHDPRVDFYQKT